MNYLSLNVVNEENTIYIKDVKQTIRGRKIALILFNTPVLISVFTTEVVLLNFSYSCKDMGYL